MNGRYNATVSLSSAAANTLVGRIVDDGLLGVAVLAGPGHLHSAANAKYERLVGATSPTFGRPLRDVLDASIVPEIVLRGVLDGSGPASVRELARKGDLSLNPQIATFTFYRVEENPTEILVVAHDVTEVVHARERAKLFATLTAELLPSIEPQAAVRSVVTQAQRALGARTSSVFVIGDDGLTLRGGAGEWDWARTSFAVPLVDWPTVSAVLASGDARFITSTEAVAAERGWLEARGIVATLCVPLRADGAAIGVLFFDFDAVKPLPIANLDFAADIGAHCAVALSRALRPTDPIRNSEHAMLGPLP